MPEASTSTTPSGLSRRTFLTHTGVAAASLLLLTACPDPETPPLTTPTISLTGGDEGVLNYLYLLERTATELYDKVLANPPADLTAAAADLGVLRDINRHNTIHRELLLLTISANGFTANSNIGGLGFDYSSFTLTTRVGVLAAAQSLADLTVAAYCGAARLLSTPVLLRLYVKMMAVKARHAAAVRDLRTPGSFAGSDVVPQSGADAGLNQVLTPAEVLAELSKYTAPIQLSVGSLPTN
ncbi:ferritin-like domain-containing protein [Hymenobacter jeollabukensis]|uniref:Ferritin-like domain-containing protein n=1 Tax=Hymenobacter jeollabukensis TaxID=2025313 RepID=A0A5R8WMK9_9BACT|nr:ferritin-like domain-containing protein [Hymenobacter jeollabukensis]TLM90622.1 ferritin-like domain-containing protein [Hymenobacter jeollabukensis]